MRLALENLKGGIKIGGLNLTNLKYADDVVLIETSRKRLQRLINSLQSA